MSGSRSSRAAIMNKTFDERWTVEAYDDQGITVGARNAWDLSAAVEIAKELRGGIPESRHHHAEGFRLSTMGVAPINGMTTK
jgi:hypothetical protein